jgi:PhnB protein
MKGFHPYITFEGNCEEALKFYENCFNGTIEYIQYYDDAAAFGSEAMKNKIMHSEFNAGPLHFMACDRSPGNREFCMDTNMTLYISFDSHDEQEKIFKKLSSEGKIHMGLEQTVWGSTVGLLTDKFGIHWMLVYNNE